MKKLMMTCLLVLFTFAIGYSQTGDKFVGKAKGAAAQCIAGEDNVFITTEDNCDNGGNVVVAFNQTWAPPKCTPTPSRPCPVYARPLWDYVSIARVTMDCDGNVLDVDCTPIYVGLEF